MVGNSFQHYLSNEAQNGLLKSVIKCLEHDGIFVFDTRFPSKEELLQPETEEYWRSYVDHNGAKVNVSTISSYNPITQVQHYRTFRKKEVNGKPTQTQTAIRMRYTYPQEMERLLDYHGLKRLYVYQVVRR